MSEAAPKLMPQRFDVRLDEDDNELMNRLVMKEKLSKAEIMRRALRVYAKSVGLEETPSISVVS